MSEELRAALEPVEAMRQACIAAVRAEQKYEGSDFPVCNAIVHAIKQIPALRASTDAGAEPVAWRHGEDGFCWRTFDSEQAAVSWGLPNGVRSKPIPLYAHPPVTDAAVAGEGVKNIRARSEAIAHATVPEDGNYRDNRQYRREWRIAWDAARAAFEEIAAHLAPTTPDTIGSHYGNGGRFDPLEAIAIGRKLDAEDGGYPAPAEPVGHWHGKDADDMLARFRKEAAEPVGLRAVVEAIKSEASAATSSDGKERDPWAIGRILKMADRALSTLTRTDEASTHAVEVIGADIDPPADGPHEQRLRDQRKDQPPMTQPVDIEALRALMERATAGPWKNFRLFGSSSPNEVCQSENYSTGGVCCPHRVSDAALIVAAVNALPSLLTELEALRAERGRMVEALGVVKRTLEEPQPAIACTIWVASSPAETLYDHICSVIDAQNDS